MIELAGAGSSLRAFEFRIGFVDGLQECAAGDGSGRDSIYVTAIFAHRQLTALTTDNVLTGLVGVLEPMLHM